MPITRIPINITCPDHGTHRLMMGPCLPGISFMCWEDVAHCHMDICPKALPTKLHQWNLGLVWSSGTISELSHPTKITRLRKWHTCIYIHCIYLRLDMELGVIRIYQDDHFSFQPVANVSFGCSSCTQLLFSTHQDGWQASFPPMKGILAVTGRVPMSPSQNGSVNWGDIRSGIIRKRNYSYL